MTCRPFRVIQLFSVVIYVWIFEKGAKELKLHPKRRFFLARISKGDDIKIRRKASPVFLPLPVYLPFIALLSLFLPVYMAWRRPESLVKSTGNKAVRGRVPEHNFHKSRHYIRQRRTPSFIIRENLRLGKQV